MILLYNLCIISHRKLFTRFSTCFSKGPNPDDLKVKRRSMRLPADIGKYSYKCIFKIKLLFEPRMNAASKWLVLILGVELGLGMTKNTNQYPQSQIIENFFSIDETELHYKNYHMKRIPIIQCRVNIEVLINSPKERIVTLTFHIGPPLHISTWFTKKRKSPTTNYYMSELTLSTVSFDIDLSTYI